MGKDQHAKNVTVRRNEKRMKNVTVRRNGTGPARAKREGCKEMKKNTSGKVKGMEESYEETLTMLS